MPRKIYKITPRASTQSGMLTRDLGGGRACGSHSKFQSVAIDGVIFGLLFLHSTAHAATALERYWKMRSYVYVILCLFLSVL